MGSLVERLLTSSAVSYQILTKEKRERNRVVQGKTECTWAKDTHLKYRKSHSAKVEKLLRGACVKWEKCVIALHEKTPQAESCWKGKAAFRVRTEKSSIADKSACLYVIIGVCWISLICYVNCLSAAGVHGVHSELSDEKDTVSAGKQSTSSEKFCHYASHRPNIHWNTEGHRHYTQNTLLFTDGSQRGASLCRLPVML